MDADANGEWQDPAGSMDVRAAFSGPPAPTADPLDVARHGTAEQKWWLAGEDKLDDEVVELLVHSGDADVAASLAGNTAVPTRALEQLAELHPEQRYWIGLNPEAPAHLKDAVPIGDHSSYALMRYCEQRGTSDAISRAIHQRYDTSPHPGGPLLGDVWRACTAKT